MKISHVLGGFALVLVSLYVINHVSFLKNLVS